jgi:valyl-tRNA synthetase
MSKSKGNIIDPLEIIESFGADAMRMALAASTTHARQIDLDRRRFEEFKNFANKIWNGARFVFMNLENLEMGDGIDFTLITLEDKWMLSRLNRIIEEVNASLKEYAFDKAALSAYDFFWKEFCAYYLEMTKPVLFGKQGTPQDKSNKQKILLVVLCNAVRLLHPMAPFITEELFQLLKKQFSSSPTTKDPYTKETLEALQSPACIVAFYPKVIRESDIDSGIEEEFAMVDQIVHAIRNIRAEMQIPPGTATALHIVGPKNRLSFAEKHQGILKALVRLESLSFAEKETPQPFASTTTVNDLKLIIPLPTEMREKEKTRLAKERDRLIQQQQGAREKLGNQDFLMKAPPQLVEKLQANLQQAEKDLFEIAQKLEELSK